MKYFFSLLLVLANSLVFAEVFYPKSATISDSQGTFTSQSFDSPSMNVSDNGSTISINWGGNKALLYQNKTNKDTYQMTQTIQGQQIIITAYRSSQSTKIYLVTVAQKFNGGSVTINFKP